MSPILSPEQIRLLRLRAQRLVPRAAGPLASPAAVLREVCGAQAQDLPAALLAVRVRSTGLAAADVERARMERNLLQAWCMRGTLHLIPVEDARWLIPLLGPALISGDRRRMAQLGWDEQSAVRGLSLVEAALARSGGMTRAEIVRVLHENRLPYEGQAPVHLIFRAALEGRLCAGPDRGKQPTIVPFESWAGHLQGLPRETALAELARRYLAAFAPAAPADLASWSGLTIGEARAAWQLIAAEITRLDSAVGSLWLPTHRLAWLEDAPPPALPVQLLPRFDNLLLGYASRDWIVPPAFAGRINSGGGLISAVLLVNGSAAGTWKLVRQRSPFQAVIDPFEKLDPSALPGLAAEAADLARFLDTPTILKIDAH